MPSRAEILQGLNAVKKITLPPTEDSRPSTSGLVGQAGGVLRVRDRQVITEATQQIVAPKPLTERQKLIEFYSQSHEAEQRQEREEHEAKERKRAEREAARERERIRKEEDAKALREAAERNQRIVEHNMFSSEIKSIFQSMDALDIVPEVMALVRSWRTEKFAPSYVTAIEQIRAQQAK